MKIKIIFLLLALTNFSLAQNGKFHSSVEIGSNISVFTNKIGYYGDSHANYFRSAPRMGFVSGINLKYDFTKNMQIGAGLLFVNCGSRYVSEKNYSSGIRETTELHYWSPNENRSVKSYILNYLEIPVYLNILNKHGINSDFSCYGGIGLYINLNSKLKYNYYYIASAGSNMYFVDPFEAKNKCSFKPASRVNNSLFLGTSFFMDDLSYGWNLKAELLFLDVYREPTMITEHVIPARTGAYYEENGVLEVVQSNMKTKLWIVSLSFFLKIFN